MSLTQVFVYISISLWREKKNDVLVKLNNTTVLKSLYRRRDRLWDTTERAPKPGCFDTAH